MCEYVSAGLLDDIFGESEQIDKARGNIRNKKIKDCDGIDH